MIPIKDDNPSYAFPFITILLIMANVGVFIYQFTLGSEAEAFIYRLGAIPWEITHFRELQELPFGFQSDIPNIPTFPMALKWN